MSEPHELMEFTGVHEAQITPSFFTSTVVISGDSYLFSFFSISIFFCMQIYPPRPIYTIGQESQNASFVNSETIFVNLKSEGWKYYFSALCIHVATVVPMICLNVLLKVL